MLTVLAEFPVKATCWVVNWWAPTPGPLYLVDKVLSEHPVIREEIPNCLEKKGLTYLYFIEKCMFNNLDTSTNL